MSKHSDGGYAFPFIPNDQPRNPDGTWCQDWDCGEPGMTLRAWLAGQAMAQMLSPGYGFAKAWRDDPGAAKVASLAVEYADALLAKLEKSE